MAGRLRPACSRSTTIDAAICAPVLPAETNASDVPVGLQLEADDHRAVGLSANGGAGLVGHLDDVGRLDDVDAVAMRAERRHTRLAEQRVELLRR